MKGLGITSLQIVTPSQKCIFKCPYCIANGHEHKNSFVNLYKEDFGVWKLRLAKFLSEHLEIVTYEYKI